MSARILVTADELARELAGDRPPRVLDVRWRLDRPDGHPAYVEGHLPGAVYVDLDHELARPGDPRDGRHPLPPVDQLRASARRWGLCAGDAVVVYDDLNNLSAARAWWLLRYAGLSDVRLLDGGLGAWRAAGHPVRTGAVTPSPGDVTLVYGSLPILTIDEAGDLPGHGVLLDARAPERFRGETEPVDPRAGHIPGARSAPTGANLGPDGRFRSAEELRDRFVALGVSRDAPVGAYCGSGVTAAHTVVALALAGFDAALYPGSWSQWANHPDRPAAVGE